MQQFKARQTHLSLILTLCILFIAGCGSGGETGHWLPGDTTAPTVTAVVPLNGAVNVAIGTRITATFSEDMDPATINGTTFRVVNTTLGGTAVAGNVTYDAASRTATFTPTVPATLAVSTNFTATITTGAKDLARNALASNYVWSFTTGLAPDAIRPRVTSTFPATTTPGPTPGMPANAAITATFSKNMALATINAASFTVVNTTLGGAAVAGAVTYVAASRTATFTPTVALAIGDTFTATITTAATDLSGNALAGNQAALPAASNYIWTFTTVAVDVTAPTITLTTPADLAAAVALNATVNATFSEAMNPATINGLNFTVVETVSGTPVAGTVSYIVSSRIATFTPTANLTASTNYTATVTAGVTDLAGNALVVPAVGLPANPWTFTTGTGLAPGAVDLKLAQPFGTFGGSAGMTNTGIQTVVDGDIGTIATTTSSVTGFHDAADIYTQTPANIGTVNGTIFTCTNSTTGPTSAAPNASNCAVATQARLDAQDAYNELATMPSDGVLAGNLAGLTINPGVWTNATSVLIQGGNLTLDALGDANAVFVFQIGSTLTVGGPGAAFPQSVILAGGAQAKNIFWQVGTSATINAAGGGTMEGTIIANSGVSFSTAGNVTVTTLNGRALSLVSSVTMVDTVINVPLP